MQFVPPVDRLQVTNFRTYSLLRARSCCFVCPNAYGRSDCHAWHSCPSDRRTYVCFDQRVWAQDLLPRGRNAFVCRNGMASICLEKREAVAAHSDWFSRIYVQARKEIQGAADRKMPDIFNCLSGPWDWVYSRHVAANKAGSGGCCGRWPGIG